MSETSPPDDELELAVHGALCTVDDPEYPGISIVDLGLLESIRIGEPGGDANRGRHVHVGLIPTFSGCPALEVIRRQAQAAVEQIDGIGDVTISWLSAPAWSVGRVSPHARQAMAREFTVAVQIEGAPATCPRCGSATVEQSMFGPSRCRSVHRCPACIEVVEVLRS